MAASRPITIGADPEALLVHTELGRVIPACGLIGGSKDKPLQLPGMPKGYSIQEDNVLVEFNVPPSGSDTEFCSTIAAAIDEVQEYIKSKGPYKLSFESQHKFAKKDLKSPQAQMFGCSPDFDAYANGEPAPMIAPESLMDARGGWRFAGGHIHIGLTTEVPLFVCAAFADVFIGLTAVSRDPQSRRRALYGSPGRYRPTPYGFEYRQLSNFWLRDYDSTSLVARAACSLARFLSDEPVHYIRRVYQMIPWGSVRTAIETNNKELRNIVWDHLFSIPRMREVMP